MIQARIQSIPCQIRVDHCFVQRPLGRSANSDWDCYGYSEIDFTVFDRKGYPATWLERKMTDRDTARIEELILDDQGDY